MSRLQHDLPQVRALEMPLVLAGSRDVCVLTSSIRLEPVVDPRSDWFVRRMATQAGDTIPD